MAETADGEAGLVSREKLPGDVNDTPSTEYRAIQPVSTVKGVGWVRHFKIMLRLGPACKYLRVHTHLLLTPLSNSALVPIAQSTSSSRPTLHPSSSRACFG